MALIGRLTYRDQSELTLNVIYSVWLPPSLLPSLHEYQMFKKVSSTPMRTAKSGQFHQAEDPRTLMIRDLFLLEFKFVLVCIFEVKNYFRIAFEAAAGRES